MRIVFWQNMMAFHQSAHIRALADMCGLEVTWVVQETLSPERAALGWPVPDPGRARMVPNPSPEAICELAAQRPEDSVHIFSGLHGYSTVERGLAACLPTRAVIGLLAERQDGRGYRGLARLVRARRDWRALRDRVGLVLAIGHGAPEWYALCGCRTDRIYPYGYFMETPGAAPRRPCTAGSATRIAYVGGLRSGKGVDLLLQALAGIPRQTWALEVVGDGPAAADLASLIARLHLAERTRFHGSLDHGSAMALLSVQDLLVLPSRQKDGWGAVVSEALMRGVPAVCTNQCGASVLLTEPWRGDVVKAGSLSALRGALEAWIDLGPRTPKERQRIIDWSQCITGESAANYLLAAIRHALGQAPRPVAPWLQTASRSLGTPSERRC